MKNKREGRVAFGSICLTLMLLAYGSTTARQLPSQDPGHKMNAELAGIKFSVPQGFHLEESSGSGIAFMRHEKYGLGLFIAVPGAQVDDEYFNALSNSVVSKLFPQEKGFEWKLLPDEPESRVSKYQTGGGKAKGFNGKKFVQTDYLTLRVKGREIVVGYITQLGPERDAKFLFNSKGVAGGSMPGWYAQAHLIASLTGEKYEAINPGTVIIGPIKKKS